jgi:hypothetical protein
MVKIAREQVIDDGLTEAFGSQLAPSNRRLRIPDVSRKLSNPPDPVEWVAFLECLLPNISKFGYAWNTP